MAKVYLAGPITGCTYGECTDWRKDFQKLLPSYVRCLSPLRGKEYLNKDKVTTIKDSYEDYALSTGKAITCRDRWDCLRADALVVNLLGATRVSIGTVMEIAWADTRRIPVVLVMEKEGNLHDHSMIKECCGYRAENLKDAASVITHLFSQD